MIFSHSSSSSSSICFGMGWAFPTFSFLLLLTSVAIASSLLLLFLARNEAASSQFLHKNARYSGFFPSHHNVCLIGNLRRRISFLPFYNGERKLCSFSPFKSVCTQRVSLDSSSFVIYPKIKATEVTFLVLIHLRTELSSFYFRIYNETGEIRRNTLQVQIRVCIVSTRRLSCFWREEEDRDCSQQQLQYDLDTIHSILGVPTIAKQQQASRLSWLS